MDLKLLELKNQSEITKENLMNILQDLSKTISVFDQMNISTEVKKDMALVQGAYQDDFIEIYVKNFIMRISEVRQFNINFEDELIDKKEYCEAIDLLENQETLNYEEGSEGNEKFRLIYTIISLYTTFIINEPIHPVGSPFPGHQKVEFVDGVYYCPVKKNNEDNPRAVCKFCIAEQTEFS